MPFEDDDELFVLPRMSFLGKLLCTSHAAETFDAYIRAHPPVQAPRARGGGNPKPVVPRDVRARLLAEHPWLEEDDLPHRWNAAGHRGPRVARLVVGVEVEGDDMEDEGEKELDEWG